MLRDSVAVVIVVVRTRPRAMPLAMITMRKSIHGFPFLSHMSMELRYNTGQQVIRFPSKDTKTQRLGQSSRARRHQPAPAKVRPAHPMRGATNSSYARRDQLIPCEARPAHPVRGATNSSRALAKY